jgi:hypothetical protein
MIELAQVTNDSNTLKILCRKLRKNQPVLLYDKEIYGAAYTAYLEVSCNASWLILVENISPFNQFIVGHTKLSA